jgi:hypothetical protein
MIEEKKKIGERGMSEPIVEFYFFSQLQINVYS